MNITVLQHSDLPSLIDRASTALAGARNSAEILEAKEVASLAYDLAKRTARLAAAKGAHDSLIAAAHRAQADALEIEAGAKRRLADEYDAAQERGEVARDGRPKTVLAENGFPGGDLDIPEDDIEREVERAEVDDRATRAFEASAPLPTSADLGLSRKDIFEARQIRDAEVASPGVVRRALDERLAAGEEPTRAAVNRAIVNRTSFTGNNQWFTPEEYLDLVRTALGEIDLDPASHVIAQGRVRAAQHFTESDDGLSKEWRGRVWLNPPYAQPDIGLFVDKMVGEVAAGRVSQAIMLTHNYTDTAWFQKAARAATSICFTRGRIRFVSPTGELAAPTQGQAFFYFGHEVARFAEAFAAVGFIVEVRQ